MQTFILKRIHLERRLYYLEKLERDALFDFLTIRCQPENWLSCTIDTALACLLRQCNVDAMEGLPPA